MNIPSRLKSLQDRFYNFIYKDCTILSKFSEETRRFYFGIFLLSVVFLASLGVALNKRVPTGISAPKNEVSKDILSVSTAHVSEVDKEDSTHHPYGEIKVLKEEIPHGEDTVPLMSTDSHIEPMESHEPEIVEDPIFVEPKQDKPEPQKPRSHIQVVSNGKVNLDKDYHRAISLLKQYKMDEARIIFQRDDIIQYTHGKALVLLFKVFLNAQNYDLLDVYAQKYLAQFAGERIELLTLYAQGLLDQKKYEEVIQKLGSSTPDVRTHSAYYSILAQAYLRKIEYEKALTIYENLAQAFPMEVKWLMGVLISQMSLKKKDEARETLQKFQPLSLSDKEMQTVRKIATALQESA